MVLYAIVKARNNKRIPNTPTFEYPIQALTYIDRHIGSWNTNVTIKKVGETK